VAQNSLIQLYPTGTEDRVNYGGLVKHLCAIRNRFKIAVLTDEKPMDYIYEVIKATGSKCSLVKMDEPLPYVHQSFALKKDSPFTSAMKYR